MKKTVHLLVGLALAATLAGCTSSSEEPEENQSVPVEEINEGTSIDPLGNDPTGPAAEKDVEFLDELGVNERGNIEVDEAESAVFKNPDTDTEFAKFTANNVSTNFECTAPEALPAANGQYVALELDVSAQEELADSGFPYFYLSVHEFRAWDADGERIPDPVGNAESCIGEDERIPSPIDPGDSESGLVILDVPEGAGTASFTMGGFQGSYGWEWNW